MGGSPSWNELSNIQAMLGEKPDEFSDAAGSACKGGDAGGQPFNEGLPHALIIMASPSAKTQFKNHRHSLSRQILQLPAMPAVART
jgi:hypothetical protein